MTADNDRVDEHVLVQESRRQWRRYAEAALAGISANPTGQLYEPDGLARRAAKVATAMMSEDRKLWNWAIGEAQQ